MLIIPVICAFIACVCMALCACLIKSGKLNFLFNIIGVSFLICLGLVTANYKHMLNEYTILLVISCATLFVTLFDLNLFKSKEENEEISDKNKFYNQLIKGAGFFLLGASLSVAVLFIGLETYYVALLGLALGLVLTFVDSIIKKSYKAPIKSFFANFSVRYLSFAGIGLLLSCVVSSLMYSLSFSNILFSLGIIGLCAYIALGMYLNTKFDKIAMYVGICLIFASILL